MGGNNQSKQKGRDGQSQAGPGTSNQQVEKDTMEDQWLYEMLVQYLTSPLWKNPIYEFIDENCIYFDEDEVNKFEQKNIHEKFKKMVEKMVDKFLQDVGISDEQFLKMAEIGLQSKLHRKIFEQILIVDNFMVFKKLMIKKNKDLELEALKEVDKQDKQRKQDKKSSKGKKTEEISSEQAEIERKQLEKEKAEIELAIQLSLAQQQEEMKEQEQFEQVLNQSKLEASEQKKPEDATEAKKPEEKKNDEPKESQAEPRKQEKPKLIDFDADEQQKSSGPQEQQVPPQSSEEKVGDQKIKTGENDAQSAQKSEAREGKEKKQVQKEEVTLQPSAQQGEEIDLQVQPKKIEQPNQKIIAKNEPEEAKANKQSDAASQKEEDQQSQLKVKKSQLPPIDGSKIQSLLDGQPKKPIDDLLRDHQQLLERLEVYKAAEDKIRSQQVPDQAQQEKQESLEDRKKRLLEQRELLKKKKQKQREEELQRYQQLGGNEGIKSQIQSQNDKPEVSKQKSLALTESIFDSQANSSISTEEKSKRKQIYSKIMDDIKN